MRARHYTKDRPSPSALGVGSAAVSAPSPPRRQRSIVSAVILVATGFGVEARAEQPSDSPATEQAPTREPSAAPPSPEPAPSSPETAPPVPPTYDGPPPLERPPPFDDEPAQPALRRERRLDVGGSVLFVSRLGASEDAGLPSGVDYEPSVGFGIHLRLPVVRWLQVGAYFGGAEIGLGLAPGALGVDQLETNDTLTTAWFGTKLYPTLHVGELVRLWASAGVGWGRYEFPAMNARDASGRFRVQTRGNSFVEFPLGVGGAVELVDEWLSLELELGVVPTVHREGTSFVGAQATDAAGRLRDIGPLPRSPLGFVQSLGLSVLL